MTKLRLPDSSIEGRKEVWIKCPKCGERFKPLLQNLEKDLELEPVIDSHAPNPDRKQAVDKILSQINMEALSTNADKEKVSLLDALPVLPEDPPRTKFFLGLTIALVIFLLGAIAYIFVSSGAPPLENQSYASVAPLDYGKDVLLFDFMALRRDLLRLRHVDRIIDYRGRESRIYKYYVPILAPELCQEITEIHLWSPRTQDGFKMEATCVDPREVTAILEVRWDLQSAKVNIQGRPMEVRLTLPQSGV
jgi:hypothetical protein